MSVAKMRVATYSSTCTCKRRVDSVGSMWVHACQVVGELVDHVLGPAHGVNLGWQGSAAQLGTSSLAREHAECCNVEDYRQVY